MTEYSVIGTDCVKLLGLKTRVLHNILDVIFILLLQHPKKITITIFGPKKSHPLHKIIFIILIQYKEDIRSNNCNRPYPSLCEWIKQICHAMFTNESHTRSNSSTWCLARLTVVIGNGCCTSLQCTAETSSNMMHTTSNIIR